MDYWYILLGVLVVIIIVLVIMIILDKKKYKHKVEIRELVQGRKRIIHDLARDFTDGDGGNYWKLRFEKDKVKKYLEVPPEEAIELDTTGRKCVTLYRDETGSYQFLVDAKGCLGEEKDIEPLKTSHRISMMDNFKKAKLRGGLSWWKENGLAVANLMIIVVLLIAVFVFWGDLYQPVKEHNAQEIEKLKLQEVIIDKIDNLEKHIQGVEGTEINEGEPPN